MNIQRKLPWCIAVILLVALRESVGSVVNVPRDNNMELLILHNNDMHARFEQTSQYSSSCSEEDQKHNLCYGGFARVADRVQDARNKANTGAGPPVLYLNAGDTYTGTVWFTLYKWNIAADFLNLLRPDAVSLGNHEFDNGVKGLSPFIRNLSCPVLCANIDYENEPELKAEKNLKKSTVINVKGRKVGIIGYLTPETKYLVSPNNVEYSDEIEAIQTEVNNLLKQGVNILIALGHSGFQIDKKIAEEVKGIDLVIGGHSNTFLWNGRTPDIELPVGPYPTIVKQKSGKKVPVVQAFAYTKYLGKLHLTINPEGEIVKYDGQPILLDGKIDRDPEVLKLLSAYRPKVVEYVETVVGSSRVLLDGSTDNCRQRECNMGNLITDAMIDAYIRLFPSANGWTDAPIAIIQGGGIRGSIEYGNITRADIMSTLPFENEIVSANVKGDVLKKVLEWSVGTYREVAGGFLQYSGIRIVYNLSEPIGQRVVSAVVRCGHCIVPNYTQILDEKEYKVIMPDFLLNGGDRFNMLQDGATLAESFNKTDMMVVEEYISKKSPVYPELRERIVLYGEDKSSGSIVKSEILGIILCLNLFVSVVL